MDFYHNILFRTCPQITSCHGKRFCDDNRSSLVIKRAAGMNNFHDVKYELLLLFSFKVHIIIGLYRVFHGFGQAKFANGGLILGSSQFTLLLQLPLKTMLSLKVVKLDLKTGNSICQSKSVTHSVELFHCLSLSIQK